MFDNVLVVCVGNICRSPALEKLLAAELPDKTIHSAGLGALVGKPVNAQMAELLRADEVPPDGHAARQLDSRLLREADVIIAMEKSHLRAIRERSPESAGKAMLATQWLDRVDVADPYRKDDAFFLACYRQLKACADSWVDKLA